MKYINLHPFFSKVILLFLALTVASSQLTFAGHTPPGTPPRSPSPTHGAGAPPAKTPKRVIHRDCPTTFEQFHTAHFKSRTLLGRGEHGSVYLHQKSEESVILKILEAGTSHQAAQLEFDRQVLASKTGAAPRPTGKVFCILEEEDNNLFAFEMEHFPNSISLKDFLKTIQSTPEAEKFSQLPTVIELALATLDLLHTGVSHNDIAPENILVIRNPAGKVIQVLFIDFGTPDDDEGHPEYHADISLSVSTQDRDFIALLLVLLKSTNEYQKGGSKPNISQITQLVHDSIYFKSVYTAIFERLTAIHLLSSHR